jgi:glycosyltransferase involved in cell wall biosynthesis
MRLVVVSHKESWVDPKSPSGYATIGGFPFQMQALSELFDRTALMVPIRSSELPPGSRPLVGRNLEVYPLAEPAGADFRRKLDLVVWLPRYLPRIWRVVRQADAVHTPVPGDIGTIGLLVALLQRKPIFVRHCGTWGSLSTLANRFLLWLLERIAGGRNVVMATGGADYLPSARNPAIKWIFATTLSEKQIRDIHPAALWQPEETLRLITVGRLVPGKKIDVVIQALPKIQEVCPLVSLDILGEGSQMDEICQLSLALGLGEWVNFHGNVPHDEVLMRLWNSHIFVFPTASEEGFPKVVLEAMACGLPVVTTAISVLPKLIGNRNGIIIDSSDASQVADAVVNLVSDRERYAKIAANTRQDSLEYTLERWRELIKERLEAHWGLLQDQV